jgi:hypothetical protein
MKGMPNVIVALARCSRGSGQSFGIRIEEMSPKKWAATWAFPLQAGAAQREGYDRTDIRGSFGLADGYPGCPSCEQRGFVQCGACEELGCWESSEMYTCPWCQRTSGIAGEIGGIRAGGDR